MSFIVVYNGGESSVAIDEEGHTAEPHGWAVADEEFVADMLADGRLLKTDMTSVNEADSNPAVIMAKKEMERRNPPPPPPPAKATKATTPAAKPETTE